MLTSDVLDITEDADLESINEQFYQRRMTDGLPIIPPTQERVARMLAGTKRSADQSLGSIGPRYGQATIEKIAINAVMAGCAPEYMSVLVAAVEALLAPEFNM